MSASDMFENHGRQLSKIAFPIYTLRAIIFHQDWCISLASGAEVGLVTEAKMNYRLEPLNARQNGQSQDEGLRQPLLDAGGRIGWARSRLITFQSRLIMSLESERLTGRKEQQRVNGQSEQQKRKTGDVGVSLQRSLIYFKPGRQRSP